MSDASRVWIYQSDRPITEEEQARILSLSNTFIEEWTSHGEKMDAALQIFHQRFLVFALDEKKALASGCGIDKCVRFVKELGADMAIDFFSRKLVFYMNENEMLCDPLHLFWAKRKAGLVSEKTLLYDNTVSILSDLKSKWLIPFEQSWHQEMWVR